MSGNELKFAGSVPGRIGIIVLLGATDSAETTTEVHQDPPGIQEAKRPTCQTCRFWKRYEFRFSVSNVGACWHMHAAEMVHPYDSFPDITPHEDFGCVFQTKCTI
jgi:hypothetical protein